MFVSILNESFASVQQNLTLQSNDHEILDFMIYKLRVLIGKENSNKQLLSNQDPKYEDDKQEAEISKQNMYDGLGFGWNYALDSGADRIGMFLNKLTVLHTGNTPFPIGKFRNEGGQGQDYAGQGHGYQEPKKYGHHLDVVHFN